MAYYFDTKNKLTDLSQRDETNYVLDTIVKALEELNEFGERDIRYDYFDLMHSLILNYSQNIKNFFLRLFYQFEKDKTEEDLNKITENEFAGKFEPTVNSFRSLKTNLERGLIIESWSIFEYAITTIFENVFKNAGQSMAREMNKKEFKKILKKIFVDTENSVLDSTSDELANTLDFHIPTIYKIDKIAKHFSSDYPEKKKDIEFIRFYNRLRNGIHNNFIYKGKDCDDFEFDGNIYRFKDGEPILEDVKSQFDNVSLARELYLVILRFFKSITVTDIIKNPSPTMEDLKREK
jgi:hypothetical protein